MSDSQVGGQRTDLAGMPFRSACQWLWLHRGIKGFRQAALGVEWFKNHRDLSPM